MIRRTRLRRRYRVLAAIGMLILTDEVLRRRPVRRATRPGLLVVQIDGLGAPALRHAIDAGFAPYLGGLVERGEATLDSWVARMPPTTPASQAGILHGHNDDIPGFRWYDKRARRVFVANHPHDAAAILRRQSDGQGLLAPDGTSIGNLLTGDARRTYLTMATVAEEPRPPGTLIRLRTFLLSPVNGLRIAVGMMREFGAELYQGWRQHDRGVEPRMHRGLNSATERAFLNAAVRSLSTELVIAEMRAGCPVIYVDYTGYDGIAHHSGPERHDSLHAVLGIDRAIARLMAASHRARRPYRLVVLSDHGQSLGQPFERQYGERLEQFIAKAMGGDIDVLAPNETEHGHWPSAIAREIAGVVGFGGVADRLAAARHRLRKGRGPTDEPDLVVCASGNLAHVYFPACPDRMTRAAIETRYPGLLKKLVNHPAVGFVLVRSGRAPLVVSSTGTRNLASDEIEGTDPLGPYPASAAADLRRLDGFSNTGDLIIVSTLDAETKEVVSFESLVGCHGGLGGAQSEPFILHPADWALDEPVVGAPMIYGQLREWIARLGR